MKARSGWLFVIIFLAKNIRCEDESDTDESDTDESDTTSDESDLFQIYPFHEDIPLREGDFQDNDSFFNEDGDDFFYDDLEAVESYLPNERQNSRYNERSKAFNSQSRNVQPSLSYNNNPLKRLLELNPGEAYNNDDNVPSPQRFQYSTTYNKRVTVDDIGVPVVPVKLKIIKESPLLDDNGSTNLYSGERRSKAQPQYNDYFRGPTNTGDVNSDSASLMMKEVIAVSSRVNKDSLSITEHLNNNEDVTYERHDRLSSQNPPNYLSYNQNRNLDTDVQGIERLGSIGEHITAPTVSSRFRGVVRRGPKGRLGVRRKVLRNGARQRTATSNSFSNSSKQLIHPNRRTNRLFRYKSNLNETPQPNFQHKDNVAIKDFTLGTNIEDNLEDVLIIPVRHDSVTPRPQLMGKSHLINPHEFVSLFVKAEADIETPPNDNLKEVNKAPAIFEKFDNYQIHRPNVQNFGEVRINDFISQPSKERGHLNTNHQETQQSRLPTPRQPIVQKQRQIFEYGQSYNWPNTQLQELQKELEEIQSYGSQIPSQQKEDGQNLISDNHNQNTNREEIQQERESLYYRPNLHRYRQSRINHVRNLNMRNKNNRVITASDNNNLNSDQITKVDSNFKNNENVRSNDRSLSLNKKVDNDKKNHHPSQNIENNNQEDLNSNTDVNVIINPIESPNVEETHMLSQALTHALKRITAEVEANDVPPKALTTSDKSNTEGTVLNNFPSRYGGNVNASVLNSNSPSAIKEDHASIKAINGMDSKNLMNENQKADIVSRQISKEIIPRIQDIQNRSSQLSTSAWNRQPYNRIGLKLNIQQKDLKIETPQNENMQRPIQKQNYGTFIDTQNSSNRNTHRNRQYPQLYGEHLETGNTKNHKTMHDGIEVQKGVNIGSYVDNNNGNQKSNDDQNEQQNNTESHTDPFEGLGKYQTLPSFKPTQIYRGNKKHTQHEHEQSHRYMENTQEHFYPQQSFVHSGPHTEQLLTPQTFVPTGQEYGFRQNYQTEQIGYPQISEFMIPPEPANDIVMSPYDVTEKNEEQMFVNHFEKLEPFPAPRQFNQHTEKNFQLENIKNQIHPPHQFGIPINGNKRPIQQFNNENYHRFDVNSNQKVSPFRNMNNPLSASKNNKEIPLYPNTNDYLHSESSLKQNVGPGEDRREIIHQRFREFSPIDEAFNLKSSPFLMVGDGLIENPREISHQMFKDLSPIDEEYNQKSYPVMNYQSKLDTNHEYHHNSLKNMTQNIATFHEPTNYSFNPISINPSFGRIPPYMDSPPFLPETVEEPFVSTSHPNIRGVRKYLDPASAPFQNFPEFEVVGFFDGHEPSPYFDVPIGPPIPRLVEIPETGFTCSGLVPGYYADTHKSSHCQSFHFCGSNGRKISYLCPDGTMFNQQLLVCDHVGRVQCHTSDQYYPVNEELYGGHTTLYSRGGAFEDFGRKLYRY